MRKRIALVLLALLLLLSGCAKVPEAQEATGEAAENVPAEEPQGEGVAARPDSARDTKNLIGFVVDDDGSIAAYMSMHGFLHTAETLGYPAKLYRAKNGANAEEAVKQAAEEGCRGLLIFSRDGTNDKAVTLASELGLKVIVPYYESTAPGLDANVVADTSDYVEELARSLSVRLQERSLKSGRILVYGRGAAAYLSDFATTVAAEYPQYTVVTFTPTSAVTQNQIDELAEYLLYHRDVKGMYVTDLDLASVAVAARSQAQALLRKNGAPSPTPTPEILPGATPEPTPNPGLLTAITVTVYASGLSDENYKLFSDNDIYALCIEPYYEAATQATMFLDKLLKGEEVAAATRINRPIAYADTIDKYTAIYEQMKEMFGLAQESEIG